MKKTFCCLVLVLLCVACQKEPLLENNIDFSNLYEIKDNPNDPVQHKRYEIYQNYGVPVFFTDTVAKIYTGRNVQGDSTFRYETLDLNWAFSSSDRGSVTYRTTHIQDPELQMKALRFAETFLSKTQPALYPYALYLTKDCYRISGAGVEKKNLICRYRNLMFSWIADLKEADMEKTALSYRNEVVEVKILNFEDELKKFYAVTDEDAYNKRWAELYPNESFPNWQGRYLAWKAECLAEAYGEEQKPALGTFRQELVNYAGWTNERVDEYVVRSRRLVGAYGFVYFSITNNSTLFTPADYADDLRSFLREMMTFPRAEFLDRWEESPLVMQKYNILYNLIRDELGVEL